MILDTRTQLNAALHDPIMTVMNFLNEVVERHPNAISLAPGRPAGQFFGVERTGEYIEKFVQYFAKRSSSTIEKAWAAIGNYGATNGLINELVASHLWRDHDIQVHPSCIAITHGAQEAMAILASVLCRRGEDVLLISEPCYIGMGGIARILGIETLSVPAGDEGLEPAAVADAIARVRRAGKRPKALYDIPDFHNPLGTSLSIGARRDLLDLAKREDLLLIEDNPYGLFAYDGPPAPTLKSLDKDGSVLYVGTFSKTMFPAVRVGYVVCDQETTDGPLALQLSKVKSLLTVNTSHVTQAIAGGVLLENDCSLKNALTERIDHYRTNRDALLDALSRELGNVPGVSWSKPAGGFFLRLRLPFAMSDDDIERCARDHGVIVCRMRWFSEGGREDEVRLSFSDTTPERVREGLARLGGYVRGRIGSL